MQSKTSVKMNFVMNFILTLSTIIFPLITFPYASRILLPIGTGKVSFASAIVSYFIMFGMMGIPLYGIRACAKVRSDSVKLSKTVQELFILNLAMMGIAFVAYLITLVLVPKFAEESHLFLLYSLVFLLNLIGFEWLYKALEQYAYITRRSIMIKFVAVVAMFCFVKNPSDYPIYALTIILANVGANIFNAIHLRHFITLQPLNTLDIKRHLKPTLTFFLMAVATTVYTSLDAVMLGFLKGNDAVGYYNAAMNIRNVLVMLVTSLSAVLLPRLSVYISQKNEIAFRTILIKALNFIVFISFPLLAFSVLLSDSFIIFLSGELFLPAVLPMILIMPTVFLIGLSNLFGIQMLVPMGKEVSVVKSVALGALINLILNSFLIPVFGISGAAIGTLAAEFFVTSYQLYILKDYVTFFKKEVAVSKFLFATAIAILCLICMLNMLIFNHLILKLVFSFVVFIITYMVSLFCLREHFYLELCSQFLKILKRG